jgi:CubicO group peptidase (beta-lactamase class C family)
MVEETKSAAPVPDELAAAIESERRRADVAGAGVAAFDRNGLLFAGGFGYANLSSGEPVTPDTLFRAASITKLFTTTLVLQEVEAGHISLSQSVNFYLDARARLRNKRGGQADDATVQHLLTHTSGLPVSWRGLEYGPLPYKFLVNGRTVPRRLEDLVCGQQTNRAPGKRIVYSNGGFELLGYLVQTVSGQPYETLLRERVLAPLEMAASHLAVEPRGRGIATPYGGLIGGAGRRPAPRLKNYSGPAGALVTSALELSRFGRMVLGGGCFEGRRLISEATLTDACTMKATNHPDLDEGLGLGFWVSSFRGRRLVGHDGGLAGVSTRIAVLPDDGVGAVVLTNGANPAFVCRAVNRILESTLGLGTELVPGSPAGMRPGSEGAWKALATRVSGRYQLKDVAPPGLLTRVMGVAARPRVSHLADGVLAVEGTGFEPAFLSPDGELGRYRVAFPMSSGSRAVIEERPNGTHLWVSIMHFQRKD